MVSTYSLICVLLRGMSVRLIGGLYSTRKRWLCSVYFEVVENLVSCKQFPECYLYNIFHNPHQISHKIDFYWRSLLGLEKPNIMHVILL